MSFALAKQVAEEALLSKKGIVGVGGSEEEIYVYVSSGEAALPEAIAGYNVRVIEVGHVRALRQVLVQPYAERTGVVRPAVGGVSVGHPLVTAGTLGTAILVAGTVYGLSNNHVLANTSTRQAARAKIGDVILQPGKVDGGVAPDDVIGYLARYVPLNELGGNLVDCALFKPTSPDVLSFDIAGLQPFTSLKKAQVGMQVVKSGRTSGVTAAKVIDVDASMDVDYGVFTATFRHQIVSECMASPGDSGSLTMDVADYGAVGLVYAGSEYITMHNHIGDVLYGLSIAPAVVVDRYPLLSLPLGLVLLGASYL